MKQLTTRQKELLSFLEDHLKQQGFPPSIREMAQFMGIRSTNGVNDHLKALERKGFISRNNGLKSRAISLRPKKKMGTHHHPKESGVTIPIVGRVAAGIPLLAEEHQEGTLFLGGSLFTQTGDFFALRVQGDSMIEKGILDGDFVIVKSQPAANPGQIVVALLDGEATVKTYRPEKDTVRLEPANSHMEPIVLKKSDARSYTLLGVVTSVFRTI